MNPSKMPIRVIKGDITTIEADAIVNAANTTLLGGGGVDGAIHRAAGPELLEECRKLGGCPTGAARITGAYDLPAKYVIHTVGPVYRNGKHGERELLESCYRNALALAEQHDLLTISFPAISTGAYRYPVNEAACIAVQEAKEFLLDHDLPEQIIFVCFEQNALNTYLRVLKEEIQHLNIFITGKVQGVWYRQSTLEKAIALGLKGYVRNEMDGSVYIEAEGRNDALQSLLAWCGRGPDQAVVSKVRAEEGTFSGYRAFVIKH